MLVQTKMTPFGLSLFSWRGSALRKVWHSVAVVTGFSVGAELLYTRFGLDESWGLTLAPFTLIGVALSIFLGFRNNACYDRFWEARKHWGGLVNNSRSFARAVLLFVDDTETVRRELILRQLAFVHALRMHLRGETDWAAQLAGLLPADELAALPDEPNAPQAVARRLGERLRDEWRAGRIDAFHLPAVEERVVANTDIQGACERILGTPLPASYTVLTHRIVGLYCALLPFGLHGTVGFLSPIVAAFVSFAFLGLDAIGSEIEDPFGKDVNDLPLDHLCRTIERDLRRALGEAELPPRWPVVDGVLT